MKFVEIIRGRFLSITKEFLDKLRSPACELVVQFRLYYDDAVRLIIF